MAVCLAENDERAYAPGSLAVAFAFVTTQRLKGFVTRTLSAIDEVSGSNPWLGLAEASDRRGLGGS